MVVLLDSAMLTAVRVSQGGPCSLVPLQNCPMFAFSHTFSLFVPF